LTEFEGKELIKTYGISVPHGKLISSSNEALKVAQKLSYPVTLKVSSVDLVHKSEKGAVRVNIKSPETLNKACEDLMKIGPTLLIEKMIEGAISELIIGVNYDPTFGKYIVIGSGGILVELLSDSISLLLPVTREDVFDALSKLKVYPMLQGYRGKPSADIDAVIDVVMSVVDLITSSDVIELDINPLLVMTKGDGAIAVDALVTLN
jgi:acyl-CoA synthetase (NDP forming)